MIYGTKFGCFELSDMEVFSQWLAEHDKQIRDSVIDEELQNFAQWLWDSNFLVDEALTIRLVEQYKDEQLKEQNK